MIRPTTDSPRSLAPRGAATSRLAVPIVGALLLGLAAPVAAQQTAPPRRPAAQPQAAPAGQTARPGAAAQGQVPRPAAQPMQVSPEMEAVLADWERRTADVVRLSGVHRRTVYDTVTGTERRGGGKFWFQAPDRGRLDLLPVRVKEGQVNERMKLRDGTPYKVVADQQMMWVCNGQDVLQIEEKEKGYYRTEIPPEFRGRSIVESPLPFLFGMKAVEVKARYRLQFGKNHTYKPGQPSKGTTIHLVAYPTRRSDATNWSQADVWLDGDDFLPHQITLRDPYGTQITQYRFDHGSLKKNARQWLQISDPFRPNLTRYKLLGEQKATPQVSQSAPAASR